MENCSENISVAIATFGREKVLLDTIHHIINQVPSASEILVIDQTSIHQSSTTKFLESCAKENLIRWIKLDKPSITVSMNLALHLASFPIVLFVDDDIVPCSNLISTHASAYKYSKNIWAVAGQVLQPGEIPDSITSPIIKSGLRTDLNFKFCSSSQSFVKSVMAGNLSVLRDRAIEVGGFDENFFGVAYRFETEFCRRIWQNGGQVLFEPKASIRHIRAESGGIRSFGNHLVSSSPMHGVGDYYFALRHGTTLEALNYILSRPFREVLTKFHLKKPWWIPFKLIGEIRSFHKALSIFIGGPDYIKPLKKYKSLIKQAQ